MSTKKTVSLVLGSGGARGLAHIGVIRCLEDRGYDIRYIAGTSIGALIGGIYAAGKLDEYEKWVRELDKADVIRLLDWSFTRGAIFKGDKIIEVLRKLVGECDIRDLPIGYTAVATDLNREREVWFTRGSLFEAIRASMAVPMIFEPVIDNDRLLVDGGLVNPVPIAPTLNDHSDLTIAVDLNAMPEGDANRLTSIREAAVREEHSEYRTRLVRFLEGLLPLDNAPEEEEVPGFFNLMMRSMDAMQTTIATFKLAAYQPGSTIHIPRDICGFFEFYLAAELIEFGYKRAGETLDSLS